MTLDNPAAVIDRLAEIENELAENQNRLENAAMDWFRFRRDRERAGAEAFVKAEGTDGNRRRAELKAMADLKFTTPDGNWVEGWEVEGLYELLLRKVRILDTRASIGQSILKAQSR